MKYAVFNFQFLCMSCFTGENILQRLLNQKRNGANFKLKNLDFINDFCFIAVISAKIKERVQLEHETAYKVKINKKFKVS